MTNHSHSTDLHLVFLITDITNVRIGEAVIAVNP